MRALRRLVSLVRAAAFVAVVMGTCTAAAQGRVDVEKARAAYLARNYAEAEERLRALVDPKTGLKELGLLSQARMYLGAVLLAQGKRDPAVEVFEKMILEDPAFEPDPLSFPGDVINTFFVVRAQLQEKITVRNNRLVAFLPFGAGQFQNGDPVLGWTFLVTEAVLVVGTGITVPMYAYHRGRAEDLASANDLRTAQLYQDRADNIRTVNLSLVGAFAAVAITGVVQANLAFVPEKVETRSRELPPLARITPMIAPAFRNETSAAPAGATLGVRGTF